MTGIISVLIAWQNRRQEQPAPPLMSLAGTEADDDTRSLLDGIADDNVSYLTIQTHSMSNALPCGVVIRDPKRIRAFLAAIRKAVKPKGPEMPWPGIIPDEISIYLQDRTRYHRRDAFRVAPFDQQVDFLTDDPPYTIGPDFQKELHREGIMYMPGAQMRAREFRERVVHPFGLGEPPCYQQGR